MSQATDAAPNGRVEQVRQIAQQYTTERGPLLIVLHAVQQQFGHIGESDVATVAEVLNLSLADVHGVISFYNDFRTEPAPPHTVVLCRAEACQAVGAEALYDQTRQHFADRPDVEVSHLFCFGNCALGPSGTLDGRLHGRLTPERIQTLTRSWQS